jgi:N-acetylmuramoyl-L-alanine amidase
VIQRNSDARSQFTAGLAARRALTTVARVIKNGTTSYDAVRAWKPTATVELHFNAVENPAERPDLKGSLVLFGAEDSRRWAQTLQDMMVALYNRQGPRENQGIHIPGPENGYKRGQRNVSQIHPSALIEPFFGHNPREAQIAIEKKQALAEGIVAAYARFAAATLPIATRVNPRTPTG